MLGVGPFYLVQRKGRYYLLTTKNLSQIFGPVTKEEVLPLVTFYEKVFGRRFATIVTESKPTTERDAPPDKTEITASPEGFKVKLILHNGHHHEFIAEKHLLVRPDGTIEVTQEEKIIKDLGQGYFF